MSDQERLESIRRSVLMGPEKTARHGQLVFLLDLVERQQRAIDAGREIRAELAKGGGFHLATFLDAMSALAPMPEPAPPAVPHRRLIISITLLPVETGDRASRIVVTQMDDGTVRIYDADLSTLLHEVEPIRRPPE